jgi:hypothetical protein
MDAADVEREILRLHQFHKVHYQVAESGAAQAALRQLG